MARIFYEGGEKVIELNDEEVRGDMLVMEKQIRKRFRGWEKFGVADGKLKERCFRAFDRGITPHQIVKGLGLARKATKYDTIYKYYQFWKLVRGKKR
jgi:hypothetical protein